ncbi:MAG TPA: glycosyl hydrolase family 28-related protein, partial [Phycisphaerae bacterium]|nr:glycosyl hydrolase family 28-related protein [Phycisphaerae bacterium]
GRYDVYVHNGEGGAYGWAHVAALEVLPPGRRAEAVFDVREHGAAGDGLADDHAALTAAMAAAHDAGGGVVFLPPGTYRIGRTLSVPAGVKLRGAGRENTLLRGEGYDGDSGVPPAAVVALTDRTALCSLTVCGAVGEGVPSVRHERPDMSTDAMVRLVPAQAGGVVGDVAILDCRLRALCEEPDGRGTLYLKAIHVGEDCFGRCRGFRLNDNEIHGSLFFYRGERMEIIGNTWRDGTATIVVAIHGWAVDSLLDSNRFVDTPGRLCFYPVRHCCIRFNEVHGAFRGTWANAEEVYLVHGSYGRYFGEADPRASGRATAAAGSTLTDAGGRWQPGLMADSTVVILAGRGFGQYRRVTGNTADTITVDRPWRVLPDETSEYVVAPMYTENVYYANLNHTPLRMSLWLDCVANVVDMHRDEHSKGIDIWGSDHTAADPKEDPEHHHAFYPAWYNLILNGWMDGATVHLNCWARADSRHQGPPAFANALVHNKIRQPHAYRTGFDRSALATGGIVVGNTSRGSHYHRSSRRHRSSRHRHHPPGRVAASHTILADNQVSFTPVGVLVAETVRKTFLLDNIFQEVPRPLLDWGADTVARDNVRFTVGDEGLRVEPEEL